MTTSRRLTFVFSMAAMVFSLSPAHAEVLSAHVAITPPTGGGLVESTSVIDMAYVTNSPTVKGTYIEVIGNTATGGFQLRLQSKDQTRVLAFWDQIAKATAAHQEFQVTVYALRTFQVGDVTGYVGDLDTGLNYFLLF